MGFISVTAGPSRIAGTGISRRAIAIPPRHLLSRRIPTGPGIVASRRFGTFTSTSPNQAPTPSTPVVEAGLESEPITEALTSNLDIAEQITSPATLGILDTLSLHLLNSPFSAGATIILLTILVRGGITFPVSIWQRRRAWRTREKVQPEMKRLNEELARTLARDMRREGKSWDEYKRELKSQLAAHQLALHKKYNTHPLITLLTPLAIHVPILITLSLTIRGALDASPAVLEALLQNMSHVAPLTEADVSSLSSGAVMRSPWMEQTFWWLPNLAEPDASVMLPIVGGVVAMINAELAGRKVKQAEGNEVRDEDVKVKEAGPVSAEAGTPSGSAVPTSAARRNQARPASSARIVRQPPTGSNTVRPLAPAEKGRRFSSSPIPTANAPEATRTKPKSYKRPVTKYISPTVVQARQRDRQEAAKSGALTSITPEQELRKEQDKASLRQRFMTNVLRGAAVVFVPFAAQVPAALALYWTTSMVFTMCQNALLDKLDERRKAYVEAQKVIVQGEQE